MRLSTIPSLATCLLVLLGSSGVQSFSSVNKVGAAAVRSRSLSPLHSTTAEAATSSSAAKEELLKRDRYVATNRKNSSSPLSNIQHICIESRAYTTKPLSSLCSACRIHRPSWTRSQIRKTLGRSIVPLGNSRWIQVFSFDEEGCFGG